MSPMQEQSDGVGQLQKEPRPEPGTTQSEDRSSEGNTTASPVLAVGGQGPTATVQADVVVKKAGSMRSNKKDILKVLIKDIPPEELKEMDLEELKKGDDGSSVLRWTKAEDDLLRTAVKRIGPRGWKRIAAEFLNGTRTDIQCLHRWQKVLRPGLVKGPWTEEEDRIIVECRNAGITKWSEIAERVKGRIGKQCRERWFNHLDPNIKRGEWTEEEDRKLFEGQAVLGNKWSQIAKLYVPGRPENAVKNRWNAATRRRRSSNKRNKADGSVIQRTPRPAGEKSKRQKTMTKVQARYCALKKELRKEEDKCVGMAMDGMLSLSMLAAASQVVDRNAQALQPPTKTSASKSGFTLDTNAPSFPPSGSHNLVTPTGAVGSKSQSPSPALPMKTIPNLSRNQVAGTGVNRRAMTFSDIKPNMTMEETLLALNTLAQGVRLPSTQTKYRDISDSTKASEQIKSDLNTTTATRTS